MKNSWNVYLLECQDGTFYTGTTINLKRRMDEHARGNGSKYVRQRGFKGLLRSKKCANRSEACREEARIKKLPRKKKLREFD